MDIFNYFAYNMTNWSTIIDNKCETGLSLSLCVSPPDGA